MSFAGFVPVLIAAIVLIGLAIAGMAIGTIFSKRCLQGGTCGSRVVRGPDGESLSCASCPNRKARTEPPAG
jgi:hypothetical protein